MSGHSKWSTIKRKKAAVDARRGKLWTKLLREITVSARLGGSDETANPRLRSAIQEARANNVPNDTIDRAIKKGTGDLEGSTYEEVSYEGYGPGGVALLVEAITDNRNRTVSELRHLFSRYGGNLGEAGCVAWMFDRRGYFAIERRALDEEAFMELALEIGADDVAIDDELYEVFSSPEEYARIAEELAVRETELAAEQLAMVPQSYLDVDPGHAASLLRLVEALEDHDDVQNVWSNANLTDEPMAAAQE